MKTLDGFSWSLALASLVTLTGCPDDTVENPFNAGSSGTSGGDGVDDGMDAPDDGMDDDAVPTSSSGDTMQLDDTGDSGTAADSGTGPGTDGDSGTTAMTGDTGMTSSTGDSGTDDSGSGSSSDGMESSSDDGMMGTPCPAGVLDMLPMTVNDSLVGEDHEFTGSCGGGGAPDLAYTIEAPADGFYVFDTQGSSFDTILYVLAGECMGAEIGCNDDANGGTSSEVGVALNEGEMATVVVDSFGIAGGAFTLNATFFAGSCPDSDLGNAVPQTSNGDTLASDNTLFGSCGGNMAGDESFTFTATEAGIYTFDTAGSDFDTVLYVREDCSGAELACNDDVSGADATSQVNVALEADEEVVVIVDGAGAETGNYTLNIELDECPDEALPSVVPQTVMGSTATEINNSDPGCGFSSGSNDYAYTFTAPADGTYTFDTNGSSFNTILYILDGETCDDTQEIACDDNSGSGLDSLLSMDMVADEQVTIVIDGSFGATGDFVLNIDALGGVCPDADLGNTIPATASGDTTVSDNTIGASCGGLASGDETYTFTAPEDGLYFVSTAGSDFNTIVAVYDGPDCTGAELACEPGGVGIPLLTDDTITIVVDGDGEEGNFDLTVDLDSCPDGDLGNMVPQTVMGSTAGLSDSVTPGCGFSPNAADFGYTFTAPTAGTYIFDTNGSTFDTILHIADGNVCGGPELGCNDDGGIGTQSLVTVNLSQDQEVIVMVDGYSSNEGSYVLNVDSLGGNCPDADLGNTIPAMASGDTTTSDNTVAPSCGDLTSNDETYTFTAPQDGLYFVSTEGSAYNTIVAAYDGADCGAPEIACAPGGVGVPMVTDQTITIAIDGDNDEGMFDVTVDLDACPDDDLGNTVPQTVMGSTAGLSDSVTPGCSGSSTAADFGYTFTAPAAGNYTFDTNGSTFDTVLHVSDGNMCGGPELACNDDGGMGLQSMVTVNLAQDQEVVVMVDGFGANQGAFTLNVN